MYFRYKKKEDELKKLVGLINSTVLGIANGKWSTVKKTSDIKHILSNIIFENKNEKLVFKRISEITTHYYKLIFNIIGSKYTEYLNAEYSSILIHYLIINMISKILDVYNNKKQMRKSQSGGGNNSNSGDYDSDDGDSDNGDSDDGYSDDGDSDDGDSDDGDSTDNIPSDSDDYQLTFDYDVNFSKNIEKAKNRNTNIIIKFIIKIIKHIDSYKNLYDKMTKRNITIVVNSDRERQQRKNLKIMKEFKGEGFEEQYELILLQLRLKQIEYRDLNTLFGSELEHMGVELQPVDVNVQEVIDTTETQPDNLLDDVEEIDYHYDDDFNDSDD